jgi:hypothetical protein
MNITTSSKIWAHRNFLTVVHQANEIIEREAGPKSETLAVYWIVGDDSSPKPLLQVTVVDSADPQTPFTVADVTDLDALRQEFQKWCSG